MNTNILRLRLLQLALQFRLLLHKLRILRHYADIALYNLRLARLNRLCQRYNRAKGLDVFSILRPTLKLNCEVNDVFDVTHNVLRVPKAALTQKGIPPPVVGPPSNVNASDRHSLY